MDVREGPAARRLEDGGPILTSGCRVSGALPDGWVEVALGIGDRRDVLLDAASPLRRLPGGLRIGAGSPRIMALLHAHRPDLVPVPEGPEDLPSVRPLWMDPRLESRGEVLDSASWLPEAGQGITVLVAPKALLSPGQVEEDVAARAVLDAERALTNMIPPQAVLTVRAQAFRRGLHLSALLFSRDGRRLVRAQAQGRVDDARGLAEEVAGRLRHRGGDRLAAGRA